MGISVVFNWGLGVESTAALVRFLEEPESRVVDVGGVPTPFDLNDVTVVTSMTGDEFPDTGVLCETHILPLLKRHGVRFVQVARKAGNKGQAGGSNVTVLSDSRETERVCLGGAYKLSEEMLAAGTLPTSGGDRLCSIHAKGEVIDEWLVTLFLRSVDAEFVQLIGFNSEELKRVADDRKADAKRKERGEMLGRRADFPLVRWGWSRERCRDYLRERFGVEFPKSACSYCPFSRGKPEVLARFRVYPERAADAVWMEHLSLALNPRLKLYGTTKGVRDSLVKDGNAAALSLFEARLNDPAAEWVVYRVRRLFRAVGLAARHLGIVYRGTRAGAEAELRRLAALKGVKPERSEGSLRAWLVTRDTPPKRKRNGPKVVYKGFEEMLVASPRVAKEKAGNGWTEERWEERVSLSLAGAVGCGA